MKVAILASYPIDKQMKWGVLRTTANIIDNLKRRHSDLEIHVITIDKNISKNEILNMDGSWYHCLRSIKFPSTITGLTIDIINIIKEVQSINPDIVQCSPGLPYGVAGSLLAKKFHVILKVTGLDIKNSERTHYSTFDYIYNPISRTIERYIFINISHVMFVSRHLEDALKDYGIKIGHPYYIPNGIEKKFFEIPNKEVDGRILFVGRVSPIKGIEFLIEAIAIVIKKINLELHIVGQVQDQAYFKMLIKMIEQLNLSSYIKFMGHLDDKDLMREYSECSVVVLPSYFEGHPGCVREAIAAGKPVIATNVGGIPDLIVSGKTGFLVEYGNSYDIADKILKLLNNSELRNEIGKEAKEFAENFDWEKIADETFMVYKKVLKLE